jgi:hypothetical protein
MLIGVVFVLLALGCGLAVNRVLRVPWSLAPLSGLASVAVLAVWCGALGAPPVVGAVLLVVLAGLGVTPALWTMRKSWRGVVACRGPILVLAAAAAIPALLLGTALAGVDVPISTHDGAFHVETIDSLRRGVPVQMWYPTGLHASVAAMLGLVPWLDTARGTIEVSLAFAVLAPLGLFALGLGIGLRPLEASVGAVVLALTYIYPYDDHIWGGWPLAMSIVLLLGLWAVAAHWTTKPSAGLAVVGGLLAGAILLTHGTEVYSAIVGLAVIAAIRWRCIQPGRLVRHLPLAVACTLVCALPYLTALVGWAGSGGASSVGLAALDDIAAHPELGAGGDWLEFLLGAAGAASFIDLPLRAILLAIGVGTGIGGRGMRAVVAWGVFTAVLFAVSFLDLAPIRWLFVVTFPWLIHHRPPQMVVLFASLLIASGLLTTIGWVGSWRARLALHPRAWRRLAVVCGVLLGFFAEGSAVSIYKTLDQVIVEQNSYSPDDGAAMAWLKQHAQPGEMIANDQAADAGIWAPYKAGLAILLPRSSTGLEIAGRTPILTNLVDLRSVPGAQAEACALHVGYVYAGARPLPDDQHLIPSRAALAGSSDLEEVFSSGDAVVFRLHLDCRAA